MDTTVLPSTVLQTVPRRQFFGHPGGLGLLAFCEGWERFSYSGMQTLLVLYATHWLFRPEQIGSIWGIGPFRHTLESLYGPLTPAGLASSVFGIYAGVVYLTPLGGGLIADRWLGKTRTIVLGAVLLTVGHALMGHAGPFLIALLCLVLGVGCFKTNITSQVGDLYAPSDLRRARGFQIFVMAISFAAMLAPLVCGTLGEKVGWAWGFGAAGVGMVVALVTYLGGRRWLPPEPEPARRQGRAAPRPALLPGEGRQLLVLVGLLPVLALASVGNEQMFNAYLLWGEANYQLVLFGHAMPITWLISFTSVITIASVGGSIAFWRWWAARRPEPDDITKLTIGAVISLFAPLALAAASLYATAGHKIGLGWAVLFHTVNEIGFANLYPVGMAHYSRCAPRGMGGTVIALYYLHLFASNMLVGRLGALLETMRPVDFWLLHAALVGAAALVLLAVRKLAGRWLMPAAPRLTRLDSQAFGETISSPLK